MMPAERLLDRAHQPLWHQLSELIAEKMGLHFPPERLPDLQRSMVGVANEFGFQDSVSCVRWLLSAPLTKARLQVLASHLTIGETYFFRDRQAFDVLAGSILPGLIRARQGREQRLRLWSAACCSGEEAYSLAILIRQLLPDIAGWSVTVLATDINPHFLRKAVAGTYGEWSFRNAPAGFKERYFTRSGEGRHAIRPEIRTMVTFEHLNLVEDVYPSLATDTNAMDVILCRNALMYFSPAQTRRVIGNLHHALIEGGWLAVSPTEASHALFPQFVTRNFPGAILYQKGGPAPRVQQTPPPEAAGAGRSPALERRPAPRRQVAARPVVSGRSTLPENPSGSEDRPDLYARAVSLYEQGRYRDAADILATWVAGQPPRPGAFSLLARALANQGRLADALAWCDRWIAADKMDGAAHYLRAVVLLEQGDWEQAQRSLKRTLYLSPDFVLAHFSLGNLARSRGRRDAAGRHFANALHLLERLQPHEPLPESDGLTAGRLTETIAVLTASWRRA